MAVSDLFHSSGSSSRWRAKAVGTVALLAACALFVQRQRRKAERDFPAKGRFITVDGVKLHYLRQGSEADPTLVLLHGNGSMAEELDISGLVQQLAERYHVIVFDRPGYGYSERPHDRSWSPEAQAELIHAALARLGVQRPLVLGHSWGAMVALAMGLQHRESVAGLVLMSGYYFPSARLDTLVLSPPALPLLGTLMRYTVSPLLGRLMWPAMVKRMFSPQPITQAFKDRYPTWISLRPSQMRASASESAAMVPSAWRLQHRYGELSVPTVVVAGTDDRQLSTKWQARRLHDRLPGSRLHLVEGAGHMVHHAAPERVVAAVDMVVDMAAKTLVSRTPPLAQPRVYES
jgi:pimeloyl-ACP methyl ester carboxylesterase